MNIPIAQQITAIIFSLTLVLTTVQLIRKHRLREEYALGWLGASLTILLFSVFGNLLTFLSSLFNVVYSPTLILVFGLLFVLVILLSQSVTLSTQANHIRDLAQNAALMELRIRQFEKANTVTISTGTTAQIEGLNE